MHKDPTYCLVNPLNFNKTNLSCIWCCSGGLETDVQFFWTTFFVLQVNHTETCYMSVIVTNVISFASLTCGVFLSRKRNKWLARWLREIRNKLVSVQLARCVESEVELWQGIAVWNVSYVEREIGMAPGQYHVVTLYVEREMKSLSCKLVIISGRGNEFNVL